MTLYDIKNVCKNDMIYLTDLKWDYLEMVELKNDELMKKIEVLSIESGYGSIIIEIDFSKFMQENKTFFNKLFKDVYIEKAQKELKEYRKDPEITDDDLEEWLIYTCKVVEYMIEHTKES